MEKIKHFTEFLNEALRAKNPNDVEEVDIDFAGDDKDLKALSKKYKLEVDEYEPGMVLLKGKKKDILAYLQSKEYDMDDSDVKDLFPELLEGKREVNKVMTAWKKAMSKVGASDDKVLKVIAKIYNEAMHDANFHPEADKTSKAIGAQNVPGIKMDWTDLGQSIAAASGYAGPFIAQGTLEYLKSIGQNAVADKFAKSIANFNLTESVSFEELIGEE